MDWLILGVVILLTVINVPIGFGLSIAAIIFILLKGTASLGVVPLNLFSGASSFPLLAIPLFILAGGLMDTSGISLRLVNMANSLVGFIRGGLAMVTVVAIVNSFVIIEHAPWFAATTIALASLVVYGLTVSPPRSGTW